MDKVFQEEQKTLAEVESKIDAIASRYERNARETQAEIADFYCVDNDDRQRLRELRQDKADALKYAEIYRSYQPSPYFGRLEVDRENGDEIETLTVLIGKEGISDSARSIVTDWRSPMGACYYANTQREFLVNGTRYQLALRRALDIRNATLISYRTEYDGETVSLEGDVIDPFLLTVLKDKRRHNRLTDIIKTIQGNQNEIIRKPRSESFVVQGCAGSGKTMILLHRLSFLKFNNRNMSLAGVKIITPNKFFDAHINDLSVELGLTAIERFSVEEYYASLIRRYSSKISVDADICSEKTLSLPLLADIYSMEYLNSAITNYHAYWKQVLAGIQEEKLRSYFVTLKIPYPNTAAHTADAASSLEQGIKGITTAIAEYEKQKKGVASRLAAIDGEIAAMQAEYDKARSNLESTRKRTISRVDHELTSLTKAQEQIEEKLSLLRRQREELQTQLRLVGEENEKYTAVLGMFSHGIGEYSNYDQFVQLLDPGSAFVREQCKEIIATIVEAETTYAKTPVYNFGKRNNLRRIIAESKAQFAVVAANIVSTQVEQAQSKQTKLRESLNALTNQLSEVTEAIRSNDKDNRSLRTRISAWRECGQLFASIDIPDVRAGLMPPAYKECASTLATYEEQRNSMNRFAQRVDSFVQTKQALVLEQQELANSGYSAEEKEFVTGCAKLVKKLSFSEISRNVMFRDLLAKYKLHEQKYQKTNFRHKLYLKLLFCSLYFTRPMNPDSFLNIDEAQDISIAEYHLLRMVLGDRCVFNLYGDINQSVYSYKGVTDWEEIPNITSGNVYVLNENYRNTLQITDFCNKEFGAEVYAIGVSGEPVIELDTASAVQWILNLKNQHPEYRVAILHRHGLKAVQDTLRSLLQEQDVSWYAVDERRLSVLSVETAKGLEFEAVVTLVDQMSNNEKYISYTRALDRLAVVRDVFSSELDIDDSAEGIDDEFVITDEPANDQIEGIVQLEDATAAKDTEHTIGKFFSWEILDHKTAIKTCDKSFFEHNGSGVPRDICWFFDSGSMKRGDSKALQLVYNDQQYIGKVAYEMADNARMRITWSAVLGELLQQNKNVDGMRAVFQNIGEDTYRIIMLGVHDGIPDSSSNNETPKDDTEDSSPHEPILLDASIEEEATPTTDELQQLTKEECALIAEFDSILVERFGAEHKLSVKQQQIVLSLYRGKSVACNAPSGSMKSVMLYLIALKEHQTSGKQTLLTAEAHLQENELVLADRLGLKGGIFSTIDEFEADFKKDKYDVIFVSYEYFRKHENVVPFVDYFTDRVSYWGFDHPAAAQQIWTQLNNCCAALEVTKFLMSKEGYDGLDLGNYEYHEIQSNINHGIVKKQTFFTADERMKWLLQNLDGLYGQGLVYCEDETSCKMLGKTLRKNKIMAEAYIDVSNPEKRERVNYLTNAFSNGGLPVLVTTHDTGKNLSNPRIRFIIHYDMPKNEQVYHLHIAQIGQLAEEPAVYDLLVLQ